MVRIPSPGRAAGFTLVELLCVLALAGIVTALAVPGYRHALHKARRCDATLALMQLQLAQERHRADHGRYGTLPELGRSDRSAAGHYHLVIASADERAFEALAIATGAQAGDADCRRMALRVDGPSVVQASGAGPGVANGDAANRRCWGV